MAAKSKKCVLVIEPQKNLMEILQSELEPTFKVIPAYSIAEAEHLFEGVNVIAVAVDVHTPQFRETQRVNGSIANPIIEFIEAIEESNFQGPIIVMGESPEECAEVLNYAGVYQSSPFTLSDLLKKIAA